MASMGPVIRITLEDMRERLTMALIERHERMGDEIQRAVNATVDSFDFDREVRIQTEAVMREVIQGAIRFALQEDKVVHAVRTALAKAIKEMREL